MKARHGVRGAGSSQAARASLSGGAVPEVTCLGAMHG